MISINIIHKKLNLVLAVLAILVAVNFSCKKNVIQEDPYKGGMEALGVKFTGEEADPNSGAPGDEVTFKVKGLAVYKDKFEFYINEVKAEVTNLTDSTLSVKVPENVSTGGTTLLLQGQSFFGPKFTVEGKVSVDASFKAPNGSNGPILDMTTTSSGDYLLVGGFTNFESQAPAIPVNGIALISRDGAFLSSLASKEGANGSIISINKLNSGKYMVSGILSGYGKRKGINSVTRLNANGSLDTMSVDMINTKPEIASLNKDTVAAYNGGVFGAVRKSFVRDEKTTLIGQFDYYVSYYYPRSTKDFKVPDITNMPQLVRLKQDGTMDSTFNYNPVTKKGYAGSNGFVNDGFMQADGKIVCGGTFSTYNGLTVNNIVRINTDGSVDQTFATGTGADGAISSVTYNAVTGKIMLSGIFNNFNGKPRNGVVMLNANGSVDDSFQFGTISGGFANYAAQLNNGKVIVSGGFDRYNGVVRQGFMILGTNGTLAVGYNNTGAFLGQIFKMVETTSTLGNPAVILIGSFSKFDNKKVGNIVRVEIKQ